MGLNRALERDTRRPGAEGQVTWQLELEVERAHRPCALQTPG